MRSKANTPLQVRTKVHADPGKVWEYWTNPEHITKWNFASDDWCCPKAENDLKVGGKYKARMEAKDGSSGFDFEAVYDEIKDRKKIAYTMTDGRKASTDFYQLGDTTQITTTFDPDSQHPLEMQKNGWQAILENFRKYTETN